MDPFVDERDYKLLSRDKYTFSVMTRIIKEECALRLSDHERLIICFTGQPYPVWIWLRLAWYIHVMNSGADTIACYEKIGYVLRGKLCTIS